MSEKNKRSITTDNKLANDNKSFLKPDGKIAVFNRGEAASRFLRGLNDYNLTYGTEISAVVFLSSGDTRFTQHGVTNYIFPAGFKPYDVNESLILKMKSMDIGALWPGWGFASENPLLPELLEKHEIFFMGPSAEAIRQLGDKIESKIVAEKVKLPVIPWGLTVDKSKLNSICKKIGFPLILKAAGGGGGRGIRIVEEPSGLDSAFVSVRSEAPGDIFIEKYISGCRHIEVQIFGDTFGNIRSFGLRECSLQRRRQKVIEEAPAPGIPEELERKLQTWAVSLGKAVSYFGAGTVEFMIDRDGNPWFLEMNPRLQVEHGVTEEAYGIDLVQMQIGAVCGQKYTESPKALRHAFEARLYAEDPGADFLPAPGVISRLHFGTGPGIRIDSGLSQGDSISPQFDAMIAKLISVGIDRKQALARLRRTISETGIIVEGGATNLDFLKFLSRRPELENSTVTTDLIDNELLKEYKNIPEDLYLPFHLTATILEYLKREKENINNFAIRPMLSGVDEFQGFIEMSSGFHTALKIQKLSTDRFLVIDKNGSLVFVGWKQNGSPNTGKLTINNTTWLMYWEEKKGEWRVSHEEHTISVKIQEKGIVRSPAPSIVTSIHVSVDEMVKKGDRLFTLEAMKMELIVSAQESGRIEKIEVHPGSQVFAGGTLLRMSSTDSGDKKELFMKNFEKKPGYAEALELFNGALFGFECSDREIDNSLKILADIPEEHLNPAVNSIFSILINTSRLFEITSPLRSFNVIQGKSGPASGRALLSILIRRPAAVIHTLPHDFRQKLMDVLSVYGVNVLETGPDLTYALYRLRKVLNSSDLKRRALTDLLTFIAGFDSTALPAPPVELYSALHVFSTDVKGSSHQTDLAESIRNSLFEITSINREFTSYRNAFSDLLNKNVDDDLLEKAIMKLPALELVPIWNLPIERIIKLDISGKIIRRMWGDYIKSVHPLQIPFAGGSSFSVFEESGKQEKTRLSVILPCGMEFRELFRLIQIHKAWSLEIFTVNNISLLDDLAGTMNESHLDYREITITSVIDNETVSYRSPIGGAYVIDTTLCQIHPASARRMKMWKFSDFKMKKISYSDGVTLFEASAREFPEDRRLIAFTEVVFPALDTTRAVKRLPEVEKNFRNACQAIRDAQFGKSYAERLHWNHLIMHVSPLPELTQSEMMSIAKDLTPHGARLGLDQVVVYTEKTIGDSLRTLSFRIRGRGNEGFHFEIEDPAETLIKPLNEEEKQEIKARRKGLNSPQTILRIILRDVKGRTTGTFKQYDILIDPSTGEQKYFELSGGYNLNQSIIFGVLSVPTPAHPDGLKRVVILSNPMRNMGSLSEEECRRIIAAMDLAKDQAMSVYWLPVSAGAKIDFDSGTENLDWTALVLRKIVDFTEQGGIIDILVAGVNVGAQSYFDAEATMVGTTRGFLVMTQDGSMVLTGKRALDFSGAVSAEDNLGIGGCERVMGPSGQAQALVNDLSDGHKLLLEHADLITHNENHSSLVATSDSFARDITSFSYPVEFNHGFKTVGEIFSEEFNPGRKKQFSVKPVMDAVRDRDSVVIDRWSYLTEGAEGVFVWETRIGGIACGLLGIDAVSYPRIGAIPPDGPENWSPSTLFPRGSYKLARGINAFNEQLPLIIFANLSGFDGSPESMRKWQLIHGAEIGRAIVNYKGPILLAVLSRYHGGAYVVFSTALNNQMEAVALKGSYASVIGGKAAANVVFSSQISRQVENDKSIRELKTKISEAKGRKKIILEAQLSELRAALNAKYSNELAVEFDSVHSVERAARVGSLKSVIEPSSLRPYIIDFLRIKLGLEGSI